MDACKNEKSLSVCGIGEKLLLLLKEFIPLKVTDIWFMNFLSSDRPKVPLYLFCIGPSVPKYCLTPSAKLK